jgi:hypothetical protein
MGNGALPHGPSYRAHPRLYQSGGGQGVEFTSAFGRAAEVHGRTASVAFDANDPSPTLAVHCVNGVDAQFEPYQSTRLSLYNAGR